MKRILPSILIALLTLPSALGAFSDVPTSHPFSDAITYVQANAIVSGYADGTYKPDAEINRAEFLKIVVSARFSKESIAACQQSYFKAQKPFIDFSDVPVTAWFAPYVCVAKLQGIVKGYPDGTMKPAQNISFVEAAKIIAVSSGLPAEINSADGVWYKPYVIFLEELKAIPLTIETFDKKITRGEMAEMIYRQKSGNKTKPSATYDSLVIGNISSGIEDCPDTLTPITPKNSSGVLPYASGNINQSITQYVYSPNTNDEAFMSIYRSTTDNSLTGCDNVAEDTSEQLIEHFLQTGNGALEELPSYMGDVLSAFGFFDSEASKIAEITNTSYPSTQQVRAFYSLEGQDLPGNIHIRVIAKKDNSYIMLSKNLETGITDQSRLLASAAFKECGGLEKPDRPCALSKLASNATLQLYVENEVKKVVEIFALSE